MPVKQSQLPHFVRKQAENASRRLTETLTTLDLVVEFHGLRLLVIELKPHPIKSTQLRTPLALMDYGANGWSLLFRGSQGQWQPLPDDAPQLSIESKIDAIINDDYGVFWRQ